MWPLLLLLLLPLLPGAASAGPLSAPRQLLWASRRWLAPTTCHRIHQMWQSERQLSAAQQMLPWRREALLLQLLLPPLLLQAVLLVVAMFLQEHQ